MQVIAISLSIAFLTGHEHRPRRRLDTSAVFEALSAGARQFRARWREEDAMSNNAKFAEIAALAGDPGRASMLNGLMDGRALTASELAQLAGITAQTASSHLTRMTEAGLLAVEKQGRHRY